MQRQSSRVAAAIRRAAAKYSDEIYFVASNGARVRIDAVIDDGSIASDGDFGARRLTSRDTLVVSRETFKKMLTTAGATSEQAVKALRGARLECVDPGDGATIERRFMQDVPCEESLDGYCVRLNTYRRGN